MIPANVPLRAARTVPFVEEFLFTDGGAPVDCTGWTGRMQIRALPGAAGDPLINLINTTDAGGGITNMGGGYWRIWIGAASIDDLPHSPEPGSTATFAYDLILTDPSGFDERWMAGDFIVENGVTI